MTEGFMKDPEPARSVDLGLKLQKAYKKSLISVCFFLLLQDHHLSKVQYQSGHSKDVALPDGWIIEGRNSGQIDKVHTCGYLWFVFYGPVLYFSNPLVLFVCNFTLRQEREEISFFGCC